MPNTTPVAEAWTCISNAEFDIEGQDQLAAVLQQFPTQPTEEADRRKLNTKWEQFLRDLRIRIGTLLKTDSVSLLLGAGASKDAGGMLIGSMPKELEQSLFESGISGQRVRAWLRLLYLALQHESVEGGSSAVVPLDRDEILTRRDNLDGAGALNVNFERVLSRLHRWRSALPQGGGRLRLDGIPAVDAESHRLDECLRHAASSLQAPRIDRLESRRTGLG